MRARILAFFAASCLTATVLSACSSNMNSAANSTPPCGSVTTSTRTAAIPAEPIAILAARRRNSSPIDQLPGPLCAAISTAAKAHLPVVLVRLDGRPTLASNTTFTTASKNRPSKTQDLNTYIYRTAEAVLALTATHPHVDVLSGTTLAAQALRSATTNTNPGQIFVLGSLLQETGNLNFASKGMLDADADDVARFLAAKRLLPDLHDDTVTFVGATLTAAPQLELDGALAANLVDIWSTIAYKSHATAVNFTFPSISSTTVPHSDQLPLVTSVPLPAPIVEHIRGRYPNTGPMRFKPDQAVLVDSAAARKFLKPASTWLKSDPQCSLKISGTTARVGSKEGQEALARNRAATIKLIIVGLGGDPARIITRGLGSYFPDYVPDHDLATGQLIPSKAELNRSVFFAPVCPKATR